MASEWRERSLGELVDNFDSIRVPVKEADRHAGPYPYYGASGIVDYVDKYLFDGEYLLVAEDGDNLKTRNTPVAFLARGKFWVNNHAHIVRGNGDADTRFLMYALKALDIRGYLTGSTMPKLTQGNLNRIRIRAPQINEQRAIAQVLGTLDEKIELNWRMNETLKATAEVIFNSWFVDFDPVRAKAAGRSTLDITPATAALFPSNFESSELGEIPKGWRSGSLAELMDIQGGTQPPASEFIFEPRLGYVRLVQIRDYESDAHITFVPDSPKLRKCRPDDIMIARYGASVARICWGLEGAYNVALVKAVPKKECFREFLRSYLQTYDFQERLIGMSNRSVQAGFNKGDIASFRMPIPSVEVLVMYQEAAWSLRARILHNNEESRTIAALRDALLPKLISGEIRLKDLEFSESMSDLVSMNE